MEILEFIGLWGSIFIGGMVITIVYLFASGIFWYLINRWRRK